MCSVGDIVNFMFSNNVNILYMNTPFIVLVGLNRTSDFLCKILTQATPKKILTEATKKKKGKKSEYCTQQNMVGLLKLRLYL